MQEKERQAWDTYFQHTTPRDFSSIEDVLWSLANRHNLYPTMEELKLVADFYIHEKE
jgi:hypothetical protein